MRVDAICICIINGEKYEYKFGVYRRISTFTHLTSHLDYAPTLAISENSLEAKLFPSPCMSLISSEHINKMRIFSVSFAKFRKEFLILLLFSLVFDYIISLFTKCIPYIRPV